VWFCDELSQIQETERKKPSAIFVYALSLAMAAARAGDSM